MRRVVITGVGPTTSIGIGIEKFWKAIKEKASGIGPVSRFDPSIFQAISAGEVEAGRIFSTAPIETIGPVRPVRGGFRPTRSPG